MRTGSLADVPTQRGPVTNILREIAGVRLVGPPSVPEDVAARIGWFIRLRWLAAAGVLAFAAAGRLLLRLQFSVAPFVFIAAGMGLYNAVFLVLNSRGRPQGRWRGRFAMLQVGIDLLVLTVLVHLGGGIENPFILFYLFHIVIAAVLLPWGQVMLQVLFASACVVGLAVGEWTGVVPHRHIGGFLEAKGGAPVEFCDNGKFVMVAVVALVMTFCVTAVLAASVAERLRRRESQLAQANTALAEQDRIKSRYVMRVAHDLAEPAGMITSCLKVVTEGMAGPMPEQALDMIRRAERKSEYLGHLIRDLLSLSRIRAAKTLPKAEVQLAGIIDDVFEELQPQAEEKTVTLERKLPDVLPPVLGNALAIRELFDNLLSNAVKYTGLGGHVQVSASNTGKELLVNVQDDGVGIPPEALPHVFDEFYRAENVRAEAVEGTGLGLSIASQILDAHGGRIWVESEEGKGATFSFSLPVAGEAHA